MQPVMSLRPISLLILALCRPRLGPLRPLGSLLRSPLTLLLLIPSQPRLTSLCMYRRLSCLWCIQTCPVLCIMLAQR